MAENELLEKLKQMEEDGMSTTRDWVGMWQDGIKYFFSDQLKDVKRHKDWDWIVINYIWPSAMQEIAKLAKNNPTIYCNPWESSDSETSEVWQSILQYLWERGINGTGMRLEQIRQILDKKIFGYSVSKIYWDDKCYWDANQKMWMGDVKYRLWHPAEFWASNEERIDQGNCGTVRYVSLEYALKRWPQFKKQLEEEADKNDTLFEGGSGENIFGSTTGLTGTGSPDKDQQSATLINNILTSDRLGGWGRNIKGGKIKIIKLSETYFHDNEEKHQKIEEDVPAEELMMTGSIKNIDGMFVDNMTGQPVNPADWPRRTVQEYDEPLYPNGRYVIRAGDTILNEDDQVYPYSRWPFIVMPHYLLPHMWQGVNHVELYKTAQDMINISISHLVNHMKQWGDPKVAVEEGAISSPPGQREKAYKIGSGAGTIIRLVKGALSGKRFEILNPPSTSPVLYNIYQMMSQEFKNLTGLQGIAQGMPMKSDTSATEANLAAMSSVDRVYLQNVYEEEWVKQCASLIGEMCQAKYDIGRMVRIVGDDGVQGAAEITQGLKDVKYDVAIMPGSMLPYDEVKKIAKYEKAYALVGQPIANPMLPDMLRVLEIPNWQKILQKMPAFQQYLGIVQLYEQVTAGKITPEQAAAIIIQEATKIYMSNPQNQIKMMSQEKKGINGKEGNVQRMENNKQQSLQ